jgi:RHS repeat-associated protein
VGNLAWSAAGLDAGQACSDSGSAAAIAARRVDRQYDALNRLVTLTFPDANGNQAWTYTPDGLPATISTLNQGGASSVTNTYSYNKRRLLTAETSGIPGWYSWTIGYAYDTHGHLASQTYPTGLVVSYAPNALGQATQAGSYASGVQYHPNGAIKQFTYGNGLVHTMVQNIRQLPQRSTDTGGALDHQYAYDGNGNVLSTIDHNDGGRSRWMAYDGLNRLTDAGSVVFGGDHWHRFTYDVLDNLKSWKLAGVKDFGNYFYDINNRLAAIDSTGGASLHTFAYDAQGNVVDKDGLGFEFDYGNRLRTAETDDGAESYRYDGLGRRVMTAMADGGQKLWMYSRDGQMLFSFKGPDNQSTHENVYLGGSLVASIDHAWPSNAITAVKYQHTDALGSPVAESNQAGVVTNRINYDPYGSLISGTAGSVGYTGHVMDPITGLTYMQQRYYDPAVGRFLSVDPVTASSINGGNFNRYKYAANNPYRFVDPDGRKETTCTGSRVGCPSTTQGALQNLPAAGAAAQEKANRIGARQSPTNRAEISSSVSSGTNDQSGEREFSHRYDIRTPLCKTSASACTEFLALALVNPISAPGLPPIEEGKNTLLFNNDIFHRTDLKTFQIINSTMEGHWFHEGSVVISFYRSEGYLWMHSGGFGSNSSEFAARFNNAIGLQYFGALHFQATVMMKGAELGSD